MADSPIKPNPLRKKILTEKTMKFLEETTETERDEFAKAYNWHVAHPIRNHYIDLVMLTDVYLGALLLMTQDDEEIFSYIVSQIPVYNYKITDTVLPYFPKLMEKFTEEQILDFIRDPKNTEALLLYSPPTSMWFDLFMYHTDILNSNRAVEGIFDQKPYNETEYVVNTYPLNLTPEWAKVLKYRFEIGIKDSRFKFGVCCTPPNEVPIAVIESRDQIFSFWYTHWFSNEEYPVHNTIASGRLQNTKVLGFPLVADEQTLAEITTYTQAQLVEMEVFSRNVLNLYTEFEFYRPKLEVFNPLIEEQKLKQKNK